MWGTITGQPDKALRRHRAPVDSFLGPGIKPENIQKLAGVSADSPTEILRCFALSARLLPDTDGAGTQGGR